MSNKKQLLKELSKSPQIQEFSKELKDELEKMAKSKNTVQQESDAPKISKLDLKKISKVGDFLIAANAFQKSWPFQDKEEFVSKIMFANKGK